ncbi:MAG: L-seryl-tRNA(Sec) selenium transferase [Coriobacteriia bacterium]|nr:L-seryl-tRNA(Sec) selenium transferase [Coriobacteriia bacterium]
MSNTPTDRSALYRSLPNIDEVLGAPAIARLLQTGEAPRALLLRCARAELDALRADIAQGRRTDPVELDEVLTRALAAAHAAQQPSLRRVINATGIVIHTNLGRSVLARAALEAAVSASQGYANLEYDIAAGKRGSRTDHVEALICELTGAEAALAVNNNAAAVLLTLAALAAGKKTIVSRGQLVEIGGSFRIPDVMAASGTVMVEVGTTNKTHLSDYAHAIGERTGLLFKAHTSNYQLVGFTEEVALSDLVALGAEREVPVVEDLGSGVLLDLSAWGLPAEPTVQASLAAGVDVVTFSGDKLLGGPQAGIICGKRAVIARLRRHPLARALRLDKMTLAALEATLRLYRDPDVAVSAIPTLRALTLTPELCRQQAERLAATVRQVADASGLGEELRVEVEDEMSLAGGGSLPGTEIPTTVVALSAGRTSAAALETALRALPTPVIARVHEKRLLFDVRTLTDSDIELLASELATLFAELANSSVMLREVAASSQKDESLDPAADARDDSRLK